jgi:hypothetical protein
MGRIIEIRESTFVKVSIGVIGAMLVFAFKAGQAYNRVDSAVKALADLQTSVNACLASCPKVAMSLDQTIRPIPQ